MMLHLAMNMGEELEVNSSTIVELYVVCKKGGDELSSPFLFYSLFRFVIIQYSSRRPSAVNIIFQILASMKSNII